MPVGLPPNLATILETWAAHLSSASAYFEIPAFEDVRSHAGIALNDSLVAYKSVYAFLDLTFKPLLILIGLISHYLYIAVKVLAECTVQHGFIALKEAWRQACIGSKLFVQFQRDLSRTAVLMEIGVIVVIILLYAIRRYLKKKRYVERVVKWYRRKRNAIQMKYYNFVDKISQTSMFLALLLPHVMYLCVIFILWYFTPRLVRYLATQTIFTSLISVYRPLVRTVLAIYKFGGVKLIEKVENDKNKNDSAHSSSAEKSSGSENSKSIFSVFTRSKKSDATQKYLEAAKSSKNKNDKSTTKKSATENSSEENNLSEELVSEITELLKYWAVFSCLSALFYIFSFLPILGRILPDVKKATAQASTKRWAQASRSWFGKLKLSNEFTKQILMFFYVWLIFLPTSVTSSAVTPSVKSSKSSKSAGQSVKSKVAAFEKSNNASRHQSRNRKKMDSFTTEPLNLVYSRLSPLAISLVETSASLSQIPGKDGNQALSMTQSSIQRVITWFRSFLDVMVWTKLISDKTKHRIISILTECASLLPALVTLFMPSYFTNYGIIFIRLIVPAANSCIILNEITNVKKEGTKSVGAINSLVRGVRYLKYWVVHFILFSTLKSFYPVLKWVPLSTHLQWIIWALFQMESPTQRFYNILEKDLVLFGLLHGNRETDAEKLDASNSTTATIFKSILSRLPSGVKDADPKVDEDTATSIVVDNDGADADEGTETGAEINDSTGVPTLPTDKDSSTSKEPSANVAGTVNEEADGANDNSIELETKVNESTTDITTTQEPEIDESIENTNEINATGANGDSEVQSETDEDASSVKSK